MLKLLAPLVGALLFLGACAPGVAMGTVPSDSEPQVLTPVERQKPVVKHTVKPKPRPAEPKVITKVVPADCPVVEPKVVEVPVVKTQVVEKEPWWVALLLRGIATLAIGAAIGIIIVVAKRVYAARKAQQA